jgi:recombinational DNA repair ATPase RecF
LLLLDDPSAELDSSSIKKLMDQVVLLGAQVIATSIYFDKSLLPSDVAVFHVEQGKIKKV